MPVADAAGPLGGACPHRAVLWSFPGAEQQQWGCMGLAMDARDRPGPPAACPGERPHRQSGGQLSCEMQDEGSVWKNQLSKLLIYGNGINNRLNLQ